MFVHALPGSGKSTLSRQFPSLFVDSDELLRKVSMTGGHKQRDFLQVVGDPPSRRKLRTLVLNELNKRTVLANFDSLTHLGFKPDVKVGYSAITYEDHLMIANRTDMLRNFSSKVLRTWCDEMVNSKEFVVLLPPGYYLGDILV